MENNKLKLLVLQLSIITGLTIGFSACSSDSDTAELIGNYKKESDFEGVARSEAVSFTIGNKAYVGSGYDGSDRLNDFWEYDSDNNTWMQKASFPGVARNGAVAFGTSSKGYFGTGYDGLYKLKDFWEFDPVANKWTQKKDFDGSARYGAVAFSIYDKGYIGTGYDGNYLKDFYQYDPETDTWTQINSLGGSKRRDAAAFVISNKAYVCTGINNGTYENDFWVYDPGTAKWTELRKISNATDQTFDDTYTTIAGVNKVGLSINGKGYLVTGVDATTSTSSYTWEYDPVNDLWTKIHAFEGSARTEAVGFSIGTKGYVTTGRSSSYYFDDLWSLDPIATYNQYD